jgi:hypothetical protein
MGLRWRMRRTQLLPVRLVKTLHSTISQISIADVLKQKIQAPKLLNSTTDKLSRCLRSRRRRQEPPHYPERDQRYTLKLLEISEGLVLIRCHRPCCRESQGSTCKDSFRILLLREPPVMEQPPSFRHRLSLDRPVYLCCPISQCPPICNEAYVGYSSYHCCS